MRPLGTIAAEGPSEGVMRGGCWEADGRSRRVHHRCRSRAGSRTRRSFAAAGASIVAVDIWAPIESVAYPLASAGDLAETARLVVESGGEVLTVRGRRARSRRAR